VCDHQVEGTEEEVRIPVTILKGKPMNEQQAGGKVPGQVYYTEEGIQPIPVMVNTVDREGGTALVTDPWGRTHQVRINSLMTTPGVQPVRQARPPFQAGQNHLPPSEVKPAANRARVDRRTAQKITTPPPLGIAQNPVDEMLSKLQHGGHPVTPVGEAGPEEEGDIFPDWPPPMPPIVPHEEPISNEADAPEMNKGVQIYNLVTKMWEDGYLLRAVDEAPPGRAMVEYGGKRQWIPMKRVRKPVQGQRRVQRAPVNVAIGGPIHPDSFTMAMQPDQDRDKLLAVNSLLKSLSLDEALRRLKTEPKEMPAINLLERGLANLKRKQEAKAPAKTEAELREELIRQFAIHAPPCPSGWEAPEELLMSPMRTPSWEGLHEEIREAGRLWQQDIWDDKKVNEEIDRWKAGESNAISAKPFSTELAAALVDHINHVTTAKELNSYAVLQNHVIRLATWAWEYAHRAVDVGKPSSRQPHLLGNRAASGLAILAANASGKDIPPGTAVRVVAASEEEEPAFVAKKETLTDAQLKEKYALTDADLAQVRGDQDQSKPCPHCGAEIALDMVACGFGTRCYAARLQAGMDEGDRE
jgi:hypothetical protein